MLNQEQSESKQAIYQQKLESAECELEAKQMANINLRKLGTAQSALKDDSEQFKTIKLLLENYITHGVYNRNEQFLYGYPYLRAK